MVGWRSWAARSGGGLVDNVGGQVRWASRSAEASAFAIIMTIITVMMPLGRSCATDIIRKVLESAGKTIAG